MKITYELDKDELQEAVENWLYHKGLEVPAYSPSLFHTYDRNSNGDETLVTIQWKVKDR